MNAKYEQYLHALWNWANEVEEKVIHSRYYGETSNWTQELEQWRNELKTLLNTPTAVTKDAIKTIESRGKQLVDHLLYDRERKGSIQTGKHTLPPLPYAYDALEPYIAKEIMQLHHDVHHKSYVDGLNTAEKMIEKWSESQNANLLRHWMREQSFNGSGHYLHTIFWDNMSPNGGGEPKGELLKKIKQDFSSVARFKQLFTNAAKSVQGSGWTMLVWQLRSGRLGIQTVEKHNMYALFDVVPLLVLDLWEHAYYLQYETNRNKYIDNWWNIVNWSDVEKRYQKIKPIIWELA